ncbi:MAG TPA: hypothetical protein VEV43_06415 [Actinomycetota bacterium]|nr:hypothetical protein [Actinomycetota bacterium]
MDLRTWTLATRIRYAVVMTATNALVVTGIAALAGSLSRSSLGAAIPFGAIAFVVHGWFWYPRAKR